MRAEHTAWWIAFATACVAHAGAPKRSRNNRRPAKIAFFFWRIFNTSGLAYRCKDQQAHQDPRKNWSNLHGHGQKVFTTPHRVSAAFVLVRAPRRKSDNTFHGNTGQLSGNHAMHERYGNTRGAQSRSAPRGRLQQELEGQEFMRSTGHTDRKHVLGIERLAFRHAKPWPIADVETFMRSSG